jgi:predicted metal-dependent hydrolase
MSGKPKISFWNNQLIERLRRKRKTIPKHWFAGSIFKSSFFDTTSICIPIIEDFVRRTSEQALPYIKDREMLKEARHLIEEEGAHSEVHTSYNKLLRNEGYDILRYEKLAESLVKFADKYLSLKSKLAISTCAEYLTGIGGIFVIDHGVLNEGVDERMKKVWLWHLLEEIDHRNACFDLYINLGGGYFRRVIAMTTVVIISFFSHLYSHLGLLRKGGNLFNPGVHLEGFSFWWGKNGLWKLAFPFLAFYRPNFHPSQIKIRDILGQKAHRYRFEEELKTYFPK